MRRFRLATFILFIASLLCTYMTIDALHRSMYVCHRVNVYYRMPVVNSESCHREWRGLIFESSYSPYFQDDLLVLLFSAATAIFAISALIICIRFWWSVKWRVQLLEAVTKEAPVVLMRISPGPVMAAIGDSEGILQRMALQPELELARARHSIIDFKRSPFFNDVAVRQHTYFDNNMTAFLARRTVARLWVQSTLGLIDGEPAFAAAWNAAVQALEGYANAPDTMPLLAALPQLFGLPWDIHSPRFIVDLNKAKARGLSLYYQATVLLPLRFALRQRNWASSITIRVKTHKDDPDRPNTKKEKSLIGEEALAELRRYLAWALS
jgi:hypothetical protein